MQYQDEVEEEEEEEEKKKDNPGPSVQHKVMVTRDSGLSASEPTRWGCEDSWLNGLFRQYSEKIYFKSVDSQLNCFAKLKNVICLRNTRLEYKSNEMQKQASYKLQVSQSYKCYKEL